uniref:Uncharacterized protein n=1 Tax=Opuntia streptacantha TaxID=393608 RepID=A0A7C8YUG7_OPUST
MLSNFMIAVENHACSFRSQSILVYIRRYRGHPLHSEIEGWNWIPEFASKRQYKTSKAKINMQADAIAYRQLAKLFNWVNNSMRKPRCRSNNQDGVFVDTSFYSFHICLKFIVHLDTPKLDVEVMCSLVIRRVRRCRNNHFRLGDSFFCSHVVTR